MCHFYHYLIPSKDCPSSSFSEDDGAEGRSGEHIWVKNSPQWWWNVTLGNYRVWKAGFPEIETQLKPSFRNLKWTGLFHAKWLIVWYSKHSRIAPVNGMNRSQCCPRLVYIRLIVVRNKTITVQGLEEAPHFKRNFSHRPRSLIKVGTIENVGYVFLSWNVFSQGGQMIDD